MEGLGCSTKGWWIKHIENWTWWFHISCGCRFLSYFLNIILLYNSSEIDAIAGWESMTFACNCPCCFYFCLDGKCGKLPKKSRNTFKHLWKGRDFGYSSGICNISTDRNLSHNKDVSFLGIDASFGPFIEWLFVASGGLEEWLILGHQFNTSEKKLHTTRWAPTS